MSEDDRMDRAERIRQLRQGRRGGRSDDTDSDPVGDQSEASEGQSEVTGEERETPNENGEDESVTQPDGNPAGSDASELDAESAGSGEDSSEAGETAEAEQADASAEAESEDVLSAAQAAAEAAAEFESDAAAQAVEEKDTEPKAEPATPAGASIASADGEATTESETRVLEFRLGEERYCLDIEFIEEIVREETVTRVPNTPEYVEGVVDLRGQITTILDPKVAAGIDADTDEQLLVVFDADTFEEHGEIGWLVDAVDQVSLIADSDVKESPIQESYINGVIERGEEFVIWTTPELALDVETTD